MTDTQFSTTTRTVLLPPFTTEELPAARSNVAQAQAAGDLAHAAAVEAGLSNPEQYDAYHTAFSDTMRALGTPMPCSCDYCRDAVAAQRDSATIARLVSRGWSHHRATELVRDAAAERVEGWGMVPVATRRIVTE